MFCAAATGDSARAEDDIEKKKLTKKADLVAAMRASNEYCSRAYHQTDDASTGKVKLFGQDQTRLYALVINATHDAEHYGNLVTYLRLNGMVPPSSKSSSESRAQCGVTTRAGLFGNWLYGLPTGVSVAPIRECPRPRDSRGRSRVRSSPRTRQRSPL